MRLTEYIKFLHKQLFLLLCSMFFLFITSTTVKAQGVEDPPRPIVVSTQQHLAFGTFYHGSGGGSVIISPAGSRSTTGTVVTIGMGYSSSRFQIVGNPGTVISVLPFSPVQLTGPGGKFMTLLLNGTNPVTPFVLNAAYPIPTDFYVGGILTVGNAAANPPGSYNGTFDITFNQE